MIVFPRENTEIVGSGFHRSGWPFVLRHLYRSLKGAYIEKDILFDDFVERSFSYGAIEKPYSSAWGGVFHHPPYESECPISILEQTWEYIFDTDLWKESVEHLKFAIFTSEYQERRFSALYPEIPTLVALHPTELSVPRWSPDAYTDTNVKRLIQIGSYLRDTRAIYRIPSLIGLMKMKLFPSIRWLRAADRKVLDYWSNQGASYKHPVTSISRVSDLKYDFMLSNSLVISMPFAASACNVVIECMARCTPLIIPKLPSFVEYLGEGYPLYIPNKTNLLNEYELDTILTVKVYEAYEYLRHIDKSFLEIEPYVKRVFDFLKTI